MVDPADIKGASASGQLWPLHLFTHVASHHQQAALLSPPAQDQVRDVVSTAFVL